jgi:methylated-DNA-[protein]-cysteine S-methyltransferase
MLMEIRVSSILTSMANLEKSQVPLDKRVYSALMEIPRGKVTTYGGMAKRVSCGSAQAVGQALARNPDSPQVPCHRVVKVDGSLSGYSGSTEPAKVGIKRRLLEEEGVIFLPDGRVDLQRCGVWIH